MPFNISMPVLHPKISMPTDWMGAWVNVWVGWASVPVEVGGGVRLAVSVTCEIIVTAGVIVPGGGIINGVAVKMLGVDEGTGLQTGKGCGGTPHESHAVRSRRKRSERVFFIDLLYPCNLKACRHFYMKLFY